MNITRWEAFREMEEFLRDFAPSFNRPLRRVGGDVESWRPVADISETDKEYLIKAELPEVRKEDVQITLQDGVMTISGERKHEQEHKDANEIRVESFYGSFSRSFSIPENVDAESIKAESRDGVLRIHIPKKEAQTSQAKSIQVQ
jgi:HSP20 family protein